jgi:hypothetical protein
MFRFFGGWVWSEGKKKGRHGRIVSNRHGHPLVNHILTTTSGEKKTTKTKKGVCGLEVKE